MCQINKCICIWKQPQATKCFMLHPNCWSPSQVLFCLVHIFGNVHIMNHHWKTNWLCWSFKQLLSTLIFTTLLFQNLSQFKCDCFEIGSSHPEFLMMLFQTSMEKHCLSFDCIQCTQMKSQREVNVNFTLLITRQVNQMQVQMVWHGAVNVSVGTGSIFGANCPFFWDPRPLLEVFEDWMSQCVGSLPMVEVDVHGGPSDLLTWSSCIWRIVDELLCHWVIGDVVSHLECTWSAFNGDCI